MSDEFSFEAIPYVLPTQNLFGRNILKVYFKFMIFTNIWNGYGASEASAAGDRGDAGDAGDAVDGVDAANRGDAGDDVASPPAPKRKRGRPRIRHKMSPKRRAMSDITKKKISESSRKFTICKGRAHLILLFH